MAYFHWGIINFQKELSCKLLFLYVEQFNQNSAFFSDCNYFSINFWKPDLVPFWFILLDEFFCVLKKVLEHFPVFERIENALHIKRVTIFVVLSNELFVYEINKVNAKIFCLHSNDTEMLAHYIIKAKTQNFLSIQ